MADGTCCRLAMLIFTVFVVQPGQFFLYSPIAPSWTHCCVDGESVSSVTRTFAVPFESAMIQSATLRIRSSLTNGAYASLSSPMPLTAPGAPGGGGFWSVTSTGMSLAFAASNACAATATGIASSTIAPARASTAWFTHAAVADGLASPLQLRIFTPALPSAVLRPPVTAWKNSTFSVIGMYQTVLPESDFTFLIAGPGGSYFVVGFISSATRCLAAVTPAPPPLPDEDLSLSEEPHPAAARSATSAQAVAMRRDK